jgi:uncharacterized surface protein with fasciclin (FAS1) repeats
MTNTFRHTLSACLVAAMISLTGCASTPTVTPVTISSVSAQTPELSTFAKLISQAGLNDSLDNSDVTVFAPTNEAFQAVPAATLDKLAKDPELLKSVLTYHVLPGRIQAASVDGSSQVVTLNGAKLNLSKAGDVVVVDEAMVTTADVAAGKGLIHVGDRVLMPPVKK